MTATMNTPGPPGNTFSIPRTEMSPLSDEERGIIPTLKGPKAMEPPPGKTGILDDPDEDDSNYTHKKPPGSVASDESEQHTKPKQRQWEWDETIQDYVARDGDLTETYTALQKRFRKPLAAPDAHPASNTAASQQSRAPNATGPKASRSRSGDSGGESESPAKAQPGSGPAGKAEASRRASPPSSYGGQLDKRFEVVKFPRRFYAEGRIFKTPWFEPSGGDMPGRRSDPAYSDNCQAFFDSKPLAKFRWFVVVRKRLNHSLCFSITTFGGKGASKTRRGRAKDFVVLHSAGVVAPEADEEEEIERDPIAVIIEDGEQFISPLARLDCSRLYTVEDDLKVMKIGRVHPDSMELLRECYRSCVE